MSYLIRGRKKAKKGFGILCLFIAQENDVVCSTRTVFGILRLFIAQENDVVCSIRTVPRDVGETSNLPQTNDFIIDFSTKSFDCINFTPNVFNATQNYSNKDHTICTILLIKPSFGSNFLYYSVY